MREGWRTERVGKAFRVVNGGTPKTGVHTYWGGPHQWITPAEMGDLSSPYVFATRRTLTNQGLQAGAELVPVNSIIMSSRAPIGYLVINQVPMAFNQGCKGLVPSAGIDTKFAYYFFLSNVQHLNDLGTGATFKELSGGKLKEVAFYYPELTEQRRIVAILDEAFEVIATAKDNTEKNLQNARELFQCKLDEVLAGQEHGWVGAKLSDLCVIKHGFAFKGTDFSRDLSSDYPIVVTPGNFTEGGSLIFNIGNTKRFIGVSPPGFRFEIGDLVVVMTDLSSKMKILGKPAFVEDSNILHNQRIGKFIFKNNNVKKRFVYYFLLTQRFLRSIKSSATGTMVKHTAPSRILGNIIYFPEDRVSQANIISLLDSIQEKTQCLDSLHKRKLKALDELKQSLLHQAFSGALTAESVDHQLVDVA